jgi:hypothetical protein
MARRFYAKELNQHLTCALCTGYLVDALTVTECLHSFCKSCFIKYLQKPILVERGPALQDRCVGCPACLSPLPKPLECVRKDTLLQNIVCKAIPHLHFREQERRIGFESQKRGSERSNEVDKAIYVVLEYIDVNELRTCTNYDAAVNNDDLAMNNNYKLTDANQRETRSPNRELYISVSSRIPLATLKRFLALRFNNADVTLFSCDEVFDDADRLALRLGDVVALHRCASVRGERMCALFETDPNSEFAHFFFTVL